MQVSISNPLCRSMMVLTPKASSPKAIQRQIPSIVQLRPCRLISSRALPSRRPAPIALPSSRTYATESDAPIPSTEASQAIPQISAEDTFDIIIIGGGNAGLALASALLAKPSIKDSSRILLLEGGSLDRVRNWTGKGEWENRVSSLTAENVEWLQSIGAWEHIEQSRSCPVEEMVVWANPSPASAPTIHFPPLDHPMARMTENTNLQRALLRRIEAVGQGKVEIRERSRVEEMKHGEGGRWVGLKIGENKWVRGSVVVGADGPNSPVRKFAKIESYGYPYPTHAVVATLVHATSPLYPNNTAFQRFLPTGPLAFLPLSSEASTMVWSTSPALAAAYKKLSPEALTTMVNAGYSLSEEILSRLNEAVLSTTNGQTPLTSEGISNLISTLVDPSTTTTDSQPPFLPPTVLSIPAQSIASFPLRLSHAETYISDRTVLVGDAAHTIHPLAGQGLNMGLADVRSLSEVFDKAIQTGSDLGSYTTLKSYPPLRYGPNTVILSTTDLLHRVYGSRNRLINWGRGIGMEVINELTPLKRILMQNAGAAAGIGGIGKGRSEYDRQFGRSVATDERRGKVGGWPEGLASGLEGWFSVKSVAGMAMGVAGEAVKNGLQSLAARTQRR